MRTKGNKITRTRTRKNTRRIIKGIRIRSRTRRLEQLRVNRRLTELRTPKASRTTVPRRSECRASTLTRHDPTPRPGPNGEPGRTHLVQIAHTASVATAPCSAKWTHRDCEVVAVDEADVIEVLRVGGRPKCHLGESSRRSAAEAVAVKVATAVTSGAAAVAGGVKGAALAAPDAAGPSVGQAEGVGLVGLKEEAASG